MPNGSDFEADGNDLNPNGSDFEAADTDMARLKASGRDKEASEE